MIRKSFVQKLRNGNAYFCGVSAKGDNKALNQDAFSMGVSENGRIALIAVADGLGSCENSAIGAHKATDIILKWVLQELGNYGRLTENVAEILVKSLNRRWFDAFQCEDIASYDTTIHYAVLYDDALLLGGIGDGIMLYSDGDKCEDYIVSRIGFSNVTNSLCTESAEKLFSNNLLSINNEEKTIIVIATDGIAEDIIPGKKYTLSAYFDEVIKEKGVDSLENELAEWIGSWETVGHCDDKTIVVFILDRE